MIVAPKPPPGSPLGNSPYVRYLLSFWLLNDLTGTFTDAANTNNTGTVVGSGITVANNLASFTGAGRIGNITDPPLNSPVNPTVMIRCRPNTLTPGGFGGYAALYANASFGFFQHNSKFVWYNQSESLTSLITTALQTLTWRRNGGTGLVELFYDGLADSSFIAGGTPFPDNGLNPLGIGGDTTGENFSGGIDYVAIFNDLPAEAIPILTADPFSVFTTTPAVSIPLTWIEHYKEDPTNGVPASENKAYSDAWLNDPDAFYLGMKPSWVLNWNRISRGLSDRTGQLEHLAFGCTLSDTERTFRGYLDDTSSPMAGTRFFPNRPLVERMIDDEDRRREIASAMIVANGFVSDYAPLGGLQFSLSGCDWIKRKFSRSRRSQLKWQPLVLVTDFDPNTTPQDVLSKPAPVVYGSLSDADEQTVADTSRATGYLPDPVNLVATVHGSPANPISRRYYVSGLNGFYGDPNVQLWTDHRGETLGVSVDVTGCPNDQELQAQVLSGTASTWVELTCDCPDADAVRVYHGDLSGSNIQGLGLADAIGSPGSFTFLDGKSLTSGGAAFAQAFDATPPLRNNTYIPGTLTGGNVTTDTGSGSFAPPYTGIRLCEDAIHRSEFLIAAHACKAVNEVYLGGVRVPDSELAAYFLVPNSTEWNAVWTNPHYIEVFGRRYTTIYVDRQYAKDHQLVATNELSPGNTLLTVNVDGIEEIGDGTGTLITSLVLQAQHFAENPGDRPWNAQGWVDASPFTFSATGDPLVDRVSFAAVDALVNLTGAGVIGYQGEAVGTVDVLSRFCLSGDFQIGFNRLGQLIASYEPPEGSPSPAIVEALTDVMDINADTLNIHDDVTSDFFNILTYRWGPEFTGRTSGGPMTVRGLHLVLPQIGGWLSILNDEYEIRDTSSIINYDQERELSIDLYFIRDTVSAAQVLTRVLDRYKNPLRTVTLTVPLQGRAVDLGEVFTVTAIDGISSSGWLNRILRCTRHELDCNGLFVNLTAYDLQRIWNG